MHDPLVATVLTLADPCFDNEQFDFQRGACACLPGRLCDATQGCDLEFNFGGLYVILFLLAAIFVVTAAAILSRLDQCIPPKTA